MLFIVVPYADFRPEEKRPEELAQFLAHFRASVPLNYNENVYLLVVEQLEPSKFNRGQLLNIGVIEATKEAKRQGVEQSRVVVVTHDVDLLPDDELLKQYDPLPVNVDALSLLVLDDAYREAYGEIIIGIGGGITATRLDVYWKANGYPNDFWMYGMEDFVFADRLKRIHARTSRATRGTLTHIDTIRKTTDKRAYLKENKLKNMQAREQREADRRTWRKNGVHNLKGYTATKEESRTENCIVWHYKCHLSLQSSTTMSLTNPVGSRG